MNKDKENWLNGLARKIFYFSRRDRRDRREKGELILAIAINFS